jgi:hypothetical protein
LLGDGVKAVPWNGCNAANIGTMRISCAQQYNYDLKWPNNGYPAVYPEPVGEVSCNGPDGSTSGFCALVQGNPGCAGSNGLDCTVGATVYGREP